jgi:hypothetical protein
MRSMVLIGALASLVVAAGLLGGGAYCAESTVSPPCPSALVQALHEAERQVDSLRPDKSGQARVFAADGSEFTAGQAMWMKSQLKLAEQSCAKNDSASAADHMREVNQLLRAHLPQ